MRIRLRLLLAAALLGALAVAAGSYWRDRQRLEAALEPKLRTIATAPASSRVDCGAVLGQRPLVLLALGQSNAGNHGQLAASAAPPVATLTEQGCASSGDPLPGATGMGGSIWRHLPALMPARPILLSVLAVDGTTLDDWTRSRGTLRQLLETRLQAMQRMGATPDYVLWQQGEADARDGTSGAQYLDELKRLAALLDDAGIAAPLLLARSTVCRASPSEAVRSAMEKAAAGNPRFVLGPDIDSLLGMAYRHDGCHLNARGLEAAARAWARALEALKHKAGANPSPARGNPG